MSGPSPLWYASRGLGMALLVVLSASVVLGIMTSGRWRSRGWPRFLTADLHRNLSLLALALLPLHGLTVVADSYAHLGLRDILVPFATAYRPLWLGLGVMSGELLVALVLTSLVRMRLGHRLWRLTHWLVYAAWPLALLHGLGTGSDTRFGWALLVYVACATGVLLALLLRLSLHRADVSAPQVAAGLLAMGGFLVAALWTMVGPLQPGWAARAGTPPDLLGSRRAAAAPTPSPSPVPSPDGQSSGGQANAGQARAALAPGLDDPLEVQVERASSGQQVTFTDQRDPSLRMSVVVAGEESTSGPFRALSENRVVCATQASLGRRITAVCGDTRLTIELFRERGGLAAELTTESAR